MWPYEHPLAQINTLQKDTLYNLRQWADNTEVSELRTMEPKDIGDLVHLNEKHGQALRDAARMFPTVDVRFFLRPLSHDLLQISVTLTPQFQWNAKLSGTGEPFYVWIQDEEEGLTILQWRSILLRPTTTSPDIDFTITVSDTIPPSLTLLTASDRWLGSDDRRVISLEDLVMPSPPPEQTQLLDIGFRNISCFGDTSIESKYRAYINTLNSIQSQAFWACYHTQMNVLISAPVASGKSVLAEAAIW